MSSEEEEEEEVKYLAVNLYRISKHSVLHVIDHYHMP